MATIYLHHCKVFYLCFVKRVVPQNIDKLNNGLSISIIFQLSKQALIDINIDINYKKILLSISISISILPFLLINISLSMHWAALTSSKSCAWPTSFITLTEADYLRKSLLPTYFFAFLQNNRGHSFCQIKEETAAAKLNGKKYLWISISSIPPKRHDTLKW